MQQFLVVGLGRFGAQVARTLVALGQEVLGLDVGLHECDELKDEVTHVVQGDATDAAVLRAIEIEQFEAAIVAIGQNFEASVLTTLGLSQAGVPYVVARAESAEQRRVLQLTGAHHVVFPEEDAGEVAAHYLLNHRLVDLLRLDARTAVFAVEVAEWAGASSEALALHRGMRALGVFRRGALLPMHPGVLLEAEDLLVLAGDPSRLRELRTISGPRPPRGGL